MAKVVSVTNSKGGTGKTSDAICIGAELAKRGKKVVLVDMDPQANLTEDLGVKITSVDPRIASNKLVSVDCTDPTKMIYQKTIPELPNLYLIPGHTQLVFQDRILLEGLLEEQKMRAKKDDESAKKIIRAMRTESGKCINAHDGGLFEKLADRLEKQYVGLMYSDKEYEQLTQYDEALVLFKNMKKYESVFDFFDYIIFDLNTYMSMCAENALAVSDSLICVTDPSIDGLRGVMTFVGLWNRISKKLNLATEDMEQCIVLNKYKGNTRFGKKIMSILRGEFGDEDTLEKELFEEFHDYYVDVPIPESVKFPESASEHVPLIVAKKRREWLLEHFSELDQETKKRYKSRYLLREDIKKYEELENIISQLVDKLMERGIL